MSSAKEGITQTLVVKLALLQDYSLIFLLETTCSMLDEDSDAGLPSMDWTTIKPTIVLLFENKP